MTSLSLGIGLTSVPVLRKGVSYSAQASALFARMGSQPSASAKTAYDNFIKSLVSAGTWTKLDFLYILAAQDAATACLNIVQNAYNCTITGSPIWVPYRSFAGDAAAAYLNTTFNPATAGGKWTQTSASFGAYFVDVTAAGQEMGADVARLQIQANPFTPVWKVNASSGYTGGTGNSQGLRSISRSGTTNTEYAIGAQVSTGAISGDGFAITHTILIGASNNAGTISFGQNSMAFAFGGQNLSAADHLALSTAMETYLQAVGGLTFYVDFSAGVNGNGTLASPWNVLTTPNTWRADLRSRALLLKRGTSARTKLSINGASSASLTKNYSVDAYGSGELPKIDGSDAVAGGSWTLDSGSIYYIGTQSAIHQALVTDTVTGWTLDANGIYYQTSKNQGRQHFVDGTRLLSVTAKSKMVNGTQFWDNAAQRQYIKTPDGTDPAGHTVTVVSRLWYVTSKANMTAGTQFWETGTSRLYIWLADSGNPASRTIDLTARKAVQCNFVDTATIKNIWSDKSDDNGVEVHFSKNVSVTNSLATHFGSDPISDATGFDYWGANTLQATGLVCSFNEAGFGANCSYQSHYTTGDIVTDNYFHDNQQGVELWDTSDGPSIVTRNIIMDIGFGLPTNVLFTGHANGLWCANDSGTSIHVVSFYANLIVNMNSEVFIIDAGTPTIRNNTVYQLVAGRAGQKVLKAQKAGTPSVTVNFHNNIVYLGASVTKDMMDIGNASAPVTSDYNDFYVSGGTATFYYGGVLQGSFAAYKVASSQDANSIITDPLLSNPTNFDFTLQAGSPAKASGGNSFVAASDYTNVAYGNPPNRGAYAA